MIGQRVIISIGWFERSEHSTAKNRRATVIVNPSGINTGLTYVKVDRPELLWSGFREALRPGEELGVIGVYSTMLKVISPLEQLADCAE